MTVFVDGEGDQEEIIEHESFGMIKINRRQGEEPLFGVDYNTGHSISIEIGTGQLRRSKYRDHFCEREIIAKVLMSEVQFSRLITSPNTNGVPCTIKYACTENFKKMEDPPEHAVTEEKMHEDVKGVARRVSANMDHLRKRLEELATGKAPTKAELKDLAHLAQQTQQAVESDMPYLTARQAEKVDQMVHASKAEIEAHIHHQLAELGKAALGEQIKKGGVTIKLGGKPSDIKQITQGGENGTSTD